MANKSKKPEFLRSRTGQLVLGLASFGFAYGFGSWAIDSGSWWHYLFAAASVLLGVSYVAKAITKK